MRKINILDEKKPQRANTEVCVSNHSTNGSKMFMKDNVIIGQSRFKSINEVAACGVSMNSALTFQNTRFDVVEKHNQLWLSASDIANALGYKSPKSISNIYARYADEFSEGMTLVINLMTNGINGSKRRNETRIFSLRGAHLIAMFSRTSIAKEFRKWVLDVLDKQIETAQPQPLTLTSAQKLEIRKAVGKKALNDGESHKRVYHALYDHFSVSEYGDILQSQFDEAVAFINSLDVRPRLADPKSTLPVVCMRIMTTIENGVVTNSSAVPNDAYVVTKGRLANLLSEPGVFSLEEMAKIAETVNRRMVELAMSAGRMLTVK
ncbi:TPA: ORF6C domain-containing protein [Vibrio cholerae]|nr:ORF6C domain-containing protein [Vibrio cholerae]